MSLSLVMLAALPSSTNYKLNNYSFGSGGTSGSTSTNYGLNATAGEQSGTTQTGTTYKNGPGEKYTQNAGVPTITLTNPATYYNKLLATVVPGSAASDTLFAVAISTDNFTTTNYVKSDNTVTATLTYPTDYRTYAGWGSGSGTLIIGLTPSTTYYVKVKAMQGKYTESAYGPVVSVATSPPTLTFTITTDTLPTPPFSISFATLTPGSVITATDKANIGLDTNAEYGGIVYVAGQNGGMTSALSGGTIAATTGDLAALSSGFGLQVATVGQTSGGPMVATSPFNGSAQNVGSASTTYSTIFTSTGAPVFSGTGAFYLKAKSSNTTPAATDYTETLTLVAAASF